MSSVSSSSVFRASSSSPRSLFSFSALPRETFSDSRSSCSSPSVAWSSRTCFRALFFRLFSSSLLVEQTWMLLLRGLRCFSIQCSCVKRERDLSYCDDSHVVLPRDNLQMFLFQHWLHVLGRGGGWGV